MHTCGSELQAPLLAVYTGQALGGLTKVTSSNGLACGGFGSRVTFTATAGTTYRIQVGGFWIFGAEGSITLNLSCVRSQPGQDDCH